MVQYQDAKKGDFSSYFIGRDRKHFIMLLFSPSHSPGMQNKGQSYLIFTAVNALEAYSCYTLLECSSPIPFKPLMTSLFLFL